MHWKGQIWTKENTLGYKEALKSMQNFLKHFYDSSHLEMPCNRTFLEDSQKVLDADECLDDETYNKLEREFLQAKEESKNADLKVLYDSDKLWIKDPYTGKKKCNFGVLLLYIILFLPLAVISIFYWKAILALVVLVIIAKLAGLI